ncbi:MAG: hypothetical protein JWP27_411 [Flaviaesturariibacter sp.]|nr:hypothetical protein [Flaviaesturariibacter sp.]
MKKYRAVKDSWIARGVAEEPIDFAIDSIRQGVRREHIIDGLTADYRRMSFLDATSLLNELYAAHGGEFRNAGRSGAALGTAMFVIGSGLTFFFLKYFSEGGFAAVPIRLLALPVLCALSGAGLLFKALVSPAKIEH